MPEAACTSTQLHVQVSPDEFPDYWNASQAIAGLAGRNTYSGYACRPVVELPDDWSSPPAGFGRLVVPKLTRLRGVTLLADVMNSPDRLDTRHGDSVNIVGDDGAGRRFDRKRFPQVFPYYGQGDYTAGPVPGFEGLPPPRFPPDPSFDDEQDAIWSAFDNE